MAAAGAAESATASGRAQGTTQPLTGQCSGASTGTSADMGATILGSIAAEGGQGGRCQQGGATTSPAQPTSLSKLRPSPPPSPPIDHDSLPIRPCL